MKEVRGPMDDTIITVPIRIGMFIRIQNIPYDLTKAEADKICAVVLGMAQR